MPVPDTRNARIALAKGWARHETETDTFRMYPQGEGMVSSVELTEWRNPQGEPDRLPDWVGTLAGVAELMQELGSDWGWGWFHGDWICFEKNHKVEDEGRKLRSFSSPDDRPGDCVGDAWLEVFGKESDGRTYPP